MTSAARLAANRANAKRSTGPRTAAGKAASARNALRHGLCAGPDSGVVVLPGEDGDAFADLRAEVLGALAPADPLEAALCERVAGLLWRLRRAAVLETEAFRRAGFGGAAPMDKERFDHLAGRLARFAGYEARLESMLRRALDTLRRMRAERRAGADATAAARLAEAMGGEPRRRRAAAWPDDDADPMLDRLLGLVHAPAGRAAGRPPPASPG